MAVLIECWRRNKLEITMRSILLTSAAILALSQVALAQGPNAQEFK